PIVGGDRQFKEVREGLFRLLDDALRWIDGQAAGAPQGSGPAAPGSVAPAPAPDAAAPKPGKPSAR
ncbi:MAG TPA: hypothetical protein VN898_15510, partial [Candidatus Binatia bacterium]|nr:hypothetical protein [Candidatus Binatia bacterium]